ncbi:MAG: glycosyltransferase family 9 protein [Candidatus Symbiothrix sp.]|jgi:ADP-heptose:LPS heptosyltransferase|nr:glycosyltransferase family 9 protein [Candidatus Symbiothrix sp.]
MARVLVIRLSALGDVAMTIPVVYSVARRYPDDEFVLVTKKSFQNIFINTPPNLTVVPFEKGVIAGRRSRACPELDSGTRNPLTAVADLHSVLRSWKIDFQCLLKGKKVAVINKGKCAKRKLTRPKNKQFKQLETSIARYQQVFEKLGYDATVDFKSLIPEKGRDRHATDKETWVGIAPFAKHAGKIYPLDQMEQVVSQLTNHPNIKLFLFGGKEDASLLDAWTKKYAHVESVAGRLSFPDELALMNDLDVMVSMDSANMHLASLVNTPVVSIWGATHPYSGFYGFNQDSKNAIQVELPCRPCSVFGNKPCLRGDYACLTQITPAMIINVIADLIRNPLLKNPKS